MSDIPASVRLNASTLTNQELAYIVDLIDYVEAQGLPHTPGWTVPGENAMCLAFQDAAKARGIKNGVVVVTQTVELRS